MIEGQKKKLVRKFIRADAYDIAEGLGIRRDEMFALDAHVSHGSVINILVYKAIDSEATVDDGWYDADDPAKPHYVYFDQ